MNDQRIAILTDTGTDTPADFVVEHDVRVVPLRVSYSDGSSFDSGVDITPQQVVERLEEEVPKTSLPSPDRIRRELERAREDGYRAAVFVTISSGLSATHQTVSLVAEQMGDFPVVVVDTRSIGAAAGLVVMEAARKVEAGVPLDRLGLELEATSRDTHVWFTVQTLDYLHRGGRIGEAVYRIGSVLNIKPVLTCNAEGRYVVAKKARGWQRALDQLVHLAEERARDFERVRLAICCYENRELADQLETSLREHVTNVVDVVRSGVSADLLVHTGPSLVGVAVQGA